MQPNDLVTKHFRLVPSQVSALRKLGITTISDLVYHFPTRFESAGASAHARGLIPGTKVTLIGTLSQLKAKKLWKSRRTVTEGNFEDGTGKVKVMWFNQPYMASYVPEGAVARVTGTVGGSAERPYLANPEVEIVPPEMAAEVLHIDLLEPKKTDEAPTLFPVYPESRGITSRWFFHALQRVFEAGVHTQLVDPIPSDICARYHLPELSTALIWIHNPEKNDHAAAARKRFAFEEIFVIQVSRARERAENETLSAFPITDGASQANTFLSSVPFPPTGAQRHAIKDILHDFTRPYPMARLLEGDVGSGKTLVAATAAYATVTSRPPNRTSGTLQVAYMAPTEILATQHFQSFIEYFRDVPINIALITGSGCKKFPSKISREKATDISRTQLLKWVANGEIAMVVGTHALIQKSIQFKNLALAIIDEQHRFGTRQRRALAKKSVITPHFLSMTATPIPRTLALTIYGDLDLSVLDELPPGRSKIRTTIVKSKERNSAYEAIRDELKKGRQAYVICPRIDEPDPSKINAIQAKSVKAEAARLQKDVFPEYVVGILHGAMKPKEKDTVMKAFERNEIQILVATSVVEVGINVPNATSIVIEGAERFGLAQLHQLRGRVMRSSHPPFCYLLSESSSEVSLKRLRTLAKSDDGFKLAEADLETRGAGDLYGRQQWGITDIGMEALKNVKLIQAAREEAQALIAKDSTLSKYPALQARIESSKEELHQE